MNPSQVALSGNKEAPISILARYIERHIEEKWQTVFQDNYSKLLDLYNRVGDDAAYGFYVQRLFQPVHEQLKEDGLRASPRLPGNLSISREWGPDDDRQRWFWSKITSTEGAPVGTIVILFFHDHLQIHIPRPPGVIALEETTKADVVEALSDLSADFRDALEAKEEFAQYIAQMSQNPQATQS